jgi:hypothetical protein
VETRRSHAETRDGSFGMNVGAGLAFGRGSLHPGMTARAHWALSPNQMWYTLGLKVDWH